jgi:hypothetical protein
MTFQIATSGSALTNTIVTSPKLNVFTDSGYSQPAGGSFGPGGTTGQFGNTGGKNSLTSLPNSTNIYFQALTNALEVPAGSTYYFSLDAQVAGITTGSSVTTTLEGDSLFSGLNNAPAVASSTYAFVWSGNATTTANITTDADWSNGYGLLNLPAGGFTQTRSQ